jgi:hypothetical protein
MSGAVDELDPRTHLLHRIHKADIEPDGLAARAKLTRQWG